MVRQFSVLVRPASDVEGQWVAHCLNWDVVTQGDSPNHAVLMMADALELVIEADDRDDFDSELRPSAPAELWKTFSEIQLHGTRISPADAEHLSTARSAMYAMIVSRVERTKTRDSADIPVPAPFVVQALLDNSQKSKSNW